VSNDERPESLEAQAAAWVPPWERQQRPPDRAYQAAAEESARRGDDPELADDEELSEAGLSDDDDDFDPAFEGADPPGYHQGGADAEPADGSEPADGAGLAEAGAEEAALGDDPAVGVDAPVRAEHDEPLPSAAELGPDIELPGAVEEAAEAGEDDLDGVPADAPLLADGDDAGSMFDSAADDDVSDDADVDIPVGELAGDTAEPDPGADDPADAQLTTPPAAGAGPEAGRAPAGAAVPEQARRRRKAPAAVVEVDERTSDDVEASDLPDLTDDAELTAALEAILLVVDEPVAEMQLAQILEQPTERVGVLLENISARYTAAGHGFDLRRAAGGWRLYTRPEYAAYVERFVLDGQSVRLTQAALETLAVVAYKQPVTRSRISAIRGVNCDGVMRTLATRGLIEECGVEGETGAHLYRTTDLFLEKLGLNNVDQLPPLAPFLPDDVEEVLDAPG
jgi:segregation and condensation protein B